MKTLTILTTMLLLASPSAAQTLDPHPDGMSIYFDEEATGYCALEYPGVFIPVWVYIVLTHPSTSSPHVLSWEARVEIETNATYQVDPSGFLYWWFEGNGEWHPYDQDLIIETGTPPLPITGDATVLASTMLVWTTLDGYAQISIGRVTDSTTFPEGAGYSAEVGSSIQCHHIFDAWGSPCAWVNPAYFGVACEPDIANENITWGGVKALY